MSIALQNLNFIIDLTDRVSRPMGHIMQSIDQVSNKFNSGVQKMGFGIAGIAGAAYSIDKLLEPTKEMQRALGEVKSLGVADETLNQLRKSALAFSTQYGGSAADVVKSSYDIQSAIAGLSGSELARFTEISGILAKGTKANVADITNYVGTMYGIFQQNADAMGKAQWVEQMAAQTAMAVNIFKSDGKGMADAFKGIGATAIQAGIAMNEQFAVVGKLQAAWSGSEAGTKYRSFLDNVGKAQETLNLKFTDTQGRMLPIVDILEKINQKFGDIDKVAESDLLKKAFGTDEAVALIKFLSKDIGGLKNDITQIGQQTNMGSVMQMADAMTDPWAKMRSGIEAISITIGTELLPVILPAITKINVMFKGIFEWVGANKELAKGIGMVTLFVFGAIGAVAAFGVAAGYAQVMTAGWELASKLLFSPLAKLATAIWTAIPAVWSFTTALFANPITWWVLGIAALTAGVIAAVVYWKDWTAVVVDFGARFLEMIGVFTLVDNALAAWEGLKNWWAAFKTWLASLNPFEAIIAGINKAIGLANMLPGVNISPVSAGPVKTGPQTAPRNGGIIKQMSSVMNANKSTSVGNVTVNNFGSPMSGAKLRDELLFAGG